MKFPVDLKLATVALVGLAAMSGAKSAIASGLFSQQEVDPARFAVVASPYAGGTAHQLLIIEQLSSARPCWSESGSGSSVVQINPLLGDFDFTGICGRSIDSNGYSIRTAGEDLGWRYNLRVVRRGNDRLLVGMPTVDRQAGQLVIARTNGLSNGFTKFNLEPGWRLTKRSFNGQVVGHVYITNDQTLASLNALALASRPTTPAISATLPRPVVLPNPTNLQSAASASTRLSGAAKPILKPIAQPTLVPSLQTRQPQPLPTVATNPRSSVPIPVPPPETIVNQSNATQPAMTKLTGFKPGSKDIVVRVIEAPY